MISHAEYKMFVKIIKKGVSRFRGRIKTEFFSYNESVVQAFIGRSDSDFIDILQSYYQTGNWELTEKLMNINPESVMTLPLVPEKYVWNRFVSSRCSGGAE